MPSLSSFFRYYLYTRRGLIHLSIVFSFFTFINTFYLVAKDWLFLNQLDYPLIILLGLIVLLPILAVLGFLDYKKGYFATEVTVGAEQNPIVVHSQKVGFEQQLKILEALKIEPTKDFLEFYEYWKQLDEKVKWKP